MKVSWLAVALFLQSADGFVTPTGNRQISAPCLAESTTACFGSNENGDDIQKSRRDGLKKIASKLKKGATILPVLVASSIALVGAPEKAEASAPVMAMPKADVRDPGLDAIENHQRKMQQQAQDDLKAFTTKARQIEAAEGPAAREKFEADYKANQEKQAQNRLDAIEKVKYDLLDQGICPFVDIEGQRQVLFLDKGVDLGEVSGTPFNLEKEFEKRSPQKSHAVQKAANREMIKCMVEDMKNRDVDPVEYFKTHQERTSAILDLPAAQATALVSKFRENLDLYGQISPPKEGEMSAKEIMAKKGKSGSSKEDAKRIKAEAKATAAAEKAAAKAKAKEEKMKAKAEAKAAKQAAKEEKAAAKVAAAAAAASAAAASAASASVEAVADAIPEAATPDAPVESISDDAVATVDEPSAAETTSKKIPIVKASAVVVAIGGGGYAFKMMKDKTASDEEERQRQFKLLMGELEEEDESSSPTSLEDVESDLSEMVFEDENTREAEETPEIEVPKKKKKRGLKMFGKKKNSREIDINVLVSDGAKAPDFAKLLAKILTFGAPGRFPQVLALPGDMPMQEFTLEAATEQLVQAQESSSLSREDAAEIFANVVNCMLIDIVDLASTSLKEKDNKLTVEALGIVVDFMNHAASLYNSIAEGVVIVPVTYGGDLGKGKLEQMYSAYAVSGMTNFAAMEGDFEDRVRLLQDVFQINEKKAEGLMMKALQKNMMEMMKSGEGMEGMEEMMKGMGDLGDMGGMGGMPGMDGEEPSPEQLREMLTALKELKDSGSIPESELAEVKKQFREAFGSSIDDVMKDADKAEGELSADDKDLLELMKSILD